MGYRKVHWFEQCWYIIKWWVKQKFKMKGKQKDGRTVNCNTDEFR